MALNFFHSSCSSGYLSGTQDVNTLINAAVIRNFDVSGNPAYIFQIGEPLLTQPRHFYSDKARALMQDKIVKEFEAILKGEQ